MKTKLASLFAAVLLAGCAGTVAPKATGPTRPSFDPMPDAKGSYENSGVLGFTNHLAIVTPTGIQRYNDLCAKWGSKFIPPVLPGEGFTTNGAVYWMDQYHLEKWANMTTWQNNPATSIGLKPP